MRAFIAAFLVLLFPFTSYAALTTGAVDTGNVSGLIKIPAADIAAIDPSLLQALDPSKAVGLNVIGATGGLTHPACIAETQARIARKQPPPAGDFPCIVPAASGIVSGVCFVNVCKGVAATGLDGILSALKGIASLSGLVTGILSKLLQGGGQGDAPPPATSPTTVAPAPLSASITSQSISANTTPLIDTSLLLKQSAVIVSDLLFALQSPAVQGTSTAH